MEITNEQLEKLGFDPKSRFGPKTVVFGPNTIEPEGWLEEVKKQDPEYVDNVYYNCVRVVTRVENRTRPVGGETRQYVVSTIMDRPKDSPTDPWTMRTEVESEDSFADVHYRMTNYADKGYLEGTYGESKASKALRVPLPQETRETLVKRFQKSFCLVLQVPGGWAHKLPAEDREGIITDQTLIQLVLNKDSTPGWKEKFEARIESYISGWQSSGLGSIHTKDYMPSDLDKLEVAEIHGPYSISKALTTEEDVVVDLNYLMAHFALPFGKAA